MNDGYIKLFRSIMDWEHYADITTCKLFLHLLLKANIKDTKQMGFLVPRGSLIVRERTIGDECGLTYQEVRTALKRLLKSGEITKKSTNKFIVINIVNYSVFQDITHEQQRTANAQLTHKQRTINALITQIVEERKNGRMEEGEKEVLLLPSTLADGETGGGGGSEPTANSKTDTVPFIKIKELYNTTCTRLAKIKTIEGERRKAVAARFKTYGMDGFELLFKTANASDFLCGGGQKNWIANFDWLIKPTNFAKVIEGNYDNKPQAGGNEYGTCISSKQVTQPDISGFHNALDHYDDEGNRIGGE